LKAAFYPDINKTYFKVGIFSVIILILFVLSYAWLTNRLSGRANYEISILFADIGGLEIGDKVIFRGMEAGRIKSVKVMPEGILITARILPEVALNQDARFYVSDSSLMGGKTLVLEQGVSEQALDITKIHQGSASTGIMALLSEGAGVVSELKKLLADLRKDDGLIAGSEQVLAHASQTIDKVGDSTGKIEQSLQQSLKEMDALIRGVQETLKENRHNLGSTLSKAPPLMDNLSTAVDSLIAVSTKLNTTLDSISNAEGSAGKLIHDPALYDKLNANLQKLDELLADIKANPKKYINIRVF